MKKIYVGISVDTSVDAKNLKLRFRERRKARKNVLKEASQILFNRVKTKRKLEERNIRKITKMAGGASYGITIPIEMIRGLGWRERQRVSVKRISGGIVIRDYRNRK